MKRFVMMAMLVATLGLLAGNKHEVPLVKQLTDRSMIPDKVTEVEVPQVKFGKKADTLFAGQLAELMQTLSEEDGSNYIYRVHLMPDHEHIQVCITAERNLNALGYFGAMKIGRKYFLFSRDKGNESYLKTLLDKDKAKLSFVIEYEIVEYVVVPSDAQLMAEWGDGRMEIVTHIVNHENLLLKQ